MYKRLLEEDFLTWIGREEILILTGSRQVWKSSFLKYIQNKLDKKTIFYNLEDLDLLNIFNESPKNLVSLLKENFDLKEKIYVFIDEIQYLHNPTNFLKFIYDEYKEQIKLIVSWSSAFYIDENFKDSLAWRKKLFHLNPLNFKEFLIFKDEEILLSSLWNFSHLTKITQIKLQSYLDEFIMFWWYPKVVIEKSFDFKKQLIWELVNSYIKKDILESKVEFQDKFFNLYKLLAFQTGQLFNSSELANTLNLSLTAVNKYINILKKTFHFYELKPFYNNLRKELTKMPKFYLQDLWIKNHFEKNFNKIEDRIDKWAIFETLVFNELRNIYSLDSMNFWRTIDKKEIDFIIQTEQIKQVFEVKYSKQKVNFDLFLNNYKNFSSDVISRENFFEVLYK